MNERLKYCHFIFSYILPVYAMFVNFSQTSQSGTNLTYLPPRWGCLATRSRIIHHPNIYPQRKRSVLSLSNTNKPELLGLHLPPYCRCKIEIFDCIPYEPHHAKRVLRVFLLRQRSRAPLRDHFVCRPSVCPWSKCLFFYFLNVHYFQISLWKFELISCQNKLSVES